MQFTTCKAILNFSKRDVTLLKLSKTDCWVDVNDMVKEYHNSEFVIRPLSLHTYVEDGMIFKSDVKDEVYEALFNDNIHESAYETISLHKTREGAEKAIANHKRDFLRNNINYTPNTIPSWTKWNIIASQINQ